MKKHILDHIGPRDGIRTRFAVSAVALYVDALTTKLLAPTHLLLFYFKNKYIILSLCNMQHFELLNAYLLYRNSLRNIITFKN